MTDQINRHPQDSQDGALIVHVIAYISCETTSGSIDPDTIAVSSRLLPAVGANLEGHWGRISPPIPHLHYLLSFLRIYRKEGKRGVRGVSLY